MEMNSYDKKITAYRLLLLMVLLVCLSLNCSEPVNRKGKAGRENNPKQRKMCVPMDNTVRAQYKTCLLRPDTGPCRADIISWYYDGKRRTCYRFLWGGCQGNGNRFDTARQCREHCFLNRTMPTMHIPNYCSLAFDFGNCFGHYNRWSWDNMAKTCKRRLYSGCGGNQNNFETKDECLKNCLMKPNNTMNRFHQFTTCIPFTVAGML